MRRELAKSDTIVLLPFYHYYSCSVFFFPVSLSPSIFSLSLSLCVGMKNTGFSYNETEGDYALGYDSSSDVPLPFFNIGWASACGWYCFLLFYFINEGVEREGERERECWLLLITFFLVIVVSVPCFIFYLPSFFPFFCLCCEGQMFMSQEDATKLIFLMQNEHENEVFTFLFFTRSLYLSLFLSLSLSLFFTFAFLLQLSTC